MKCIILAAPRSGSTRLLESFRNSYNFKINHEPFNKDVNKDIERLYRFKYAPDKIKDNHVFKCLTWFNHWPNNQKTQEDIQEELDIEKNYFLSENYVKRKTDFFLDYISYFDKIILLTRRNFGDQLKSLLIADFKWNHRDDNKQYIFHSDYGDIDIKFDNNSIIQTNHMLHAVRFVEVISSIKNIPILYYEDLFAEKELFLRTCKKFDLNIESSYDLYINPEKRYRKNIGKNL